jgi:hypothetical protein
MEDFILKAISQVNEKVEPIFGQMYWYLDTTYQDGDTAFLMGYAEDSTSFVELAVYQNNEIQVRFFDGESWELQQDF